jgi:DNA-directed RNA polymerase subunit RPC12/RpoP
MATQISNYQCPACTGPLQFSAATGKLECEYCGSSFEVAQIQALYAPKEEAAVAQAEPVQQPAEPETQWDTSGLSEDWRGEDAALRAYVCPSCGAELLCEATTAATSCPYCGNPTVVPGQFAGALRPDFVIPFRLAKKDAISALKSHFGGKPFLPGTFLARHTVEKIQGVYVPFWLYDGHVSGDYRYDATLVHVHREKDTEVTVTDHYVLERRGSMRFEKVPVDASSKMPDDYMDSIEPYDYQELKPFSTAYLPGFLADRYDVPIEQANARADKRCIYSLEAGFEGTLKGFTTYMAFPDNPVHIQRGKVHYALLPVWLLNVKYAQKDYLFAVNGQTGKVCGQLPVSKGRAWAFFAKLAVPLSALGALLAYIIVR